MSDWTQAICSECWSEANPDREPVVARLGRYADEEICCKCGARTTAGIFIRVDPATVPFPTRKREEATQ